MWGARVVIPKKLRAAVLQMLHEGHMGIVRMKRITRSYTWWPGLDKDIEKLDKACNSCQQVQKNARICFVAPMDVAI